MTRALAVSFLTHRAWVDGRAALESLDREADQVLEKRRWLLRREAAEGR